MADSKKTVNPVAVGAAGAVIGMAAGAAAIALSDKANRKKVQKTMNDMRVWGDKKVNDIKTQVTKSQNEMVKTAGELKDEVTGKDEQPKKTSTPTTSASRSTAAHA